MKNLEKQGSAGLIAIIIFVALIIGLVMTNRWLQKEASDIASKPIDTLTVEPLFQKKQATQTKKGKGEIIRKTRFSPDRKHEINRFYQGGEEIASFKSSKAEIYDRSGKIPDGRVRFVNDSDGTYGVEYYRDEERHGPVKLYYSDGQLKKEFYYQYGTLMTCTEYYHDGTIRMEEDYSDAREHMDDTEVGIGKVYSRNGVLKYEWYMTNNEPIGFKKSYNQRGELVDEVYYDEYGQLIEQEEVLPSSGTPRSTKASPDINMPLNPNTPPIVEKPPKQIFVPAR